MNADPVFTVQLDCKSSPGPGRVQLPTHGHDRSAAAVAAGAGVHAQAAWEALDPAWAKIRGLYNAGAREFWTTSRGGAPVRSVEVVAASVFDSGLADTNRELLWTRTLARAAASTDGYTPGWFARSRARNFERLYERWVRTNDNPVLERVRNPRWAARIAIAALEHPTLLTEALHPPDSYTNLGQFVRRVDPNPGVLRRADIWCAVLGRRLAAGGGDRLRTGLQFAVGGGWALSELAEVTEVCTPAS